MPYGRGGAGNFYQAEEDKKRAHADLEAAHPVPAASIAGPDDATVNDPPSQTQSQEYAHTGRGGAGNWFSPKDLNRTGQFTSSTTAPAANTTVAHDGQLPTARFGRGGMGNMVWNTEEAEEKRKREQDEADKKIELSEKVKQDVEAGLARPGKVVLGEDVGVGTAKGRWN